MLVVACDHANPDAMLALKLANNLRRLILSNVCLLQANEQANLTVDSTADNRLSLAL